jgi:hypothetical protein
MKGRDAKQHTALLAELEALMREISEEQYRAGWHEGLEFWLWEEIRKDRWDPTRLQLERRFLLTRASALLGGWLRWNHGVKFIPYAEWIKLYAAWKKKHGGES